MRIVPEYGWDVGKPSSVSLALSHSRADTVVKATSHPYGECHIWGCQTVKCDIATSVCPILHLNLVL